jgi:hypothetical protein
MSAASDDDRRVRRPGVVLGGVGLCGGKHHLAHSVFVERVTFEVSVHDLYSQRHPSSLSRVLTCLIFAPARTFDGS